MKNLTANIITKQAQRDDFEPISKLIAVQNQNPETHCIHSDTGDEKNILAEIIRLDADSQICFVTVKQNEQLIGALGCEYDEGLGRGWLRGPFLAGNPENWESIALTLLNELRQTLPPVIHILDSFLNIDNRRGNDFNLSNGFQQLRLAHVYDPVSPSAIDSCQLLEEESG